MNISPVNVPGGENLMLLFLASSTFNLSESVNYAAVVLQILAANSYCFH